LTQNGDVYTAAKLLCKQTSKSEEDLLDLSFLVTYFKTVISCIINMQMCLYCLRTQSKQHDTRTYKLIKIFRNLLAWQDRLMVYVGKHNDGQQKYNGELQMWERKMQHWQSCCIQAPSYCHSLDSLSQLFNVFTFSSIILYSDLQHMVIIIRSRNLQLTVKM